MKHLPKRTFASLGAARIWRSSDDELEESPQFGMRCLMVCDDSSDQILAREILAVAEARLSPKGFSVLVMRCVMGLTYEEVGEALGLTRERARQIEATAVRKIRPFLMPPPGV